MLSQTLSFLFIAFRLVARFRQWGCCRSQVQEGSLGGLSSKVWSTFFGVFFESFAWPGQFCASSCCASRSSYRLVWHSALCSWLWGLTGQGFTRRVALSWPWDILRFGYPYFQSPWKRMQILTVQFQSRHVMPMQGRWAMEAAAGPPDSMHESAKASPSSGFISWTTDSQQPETRHLKSHVVFLWCFMMFYVIFQ